MRPVPAAAAAAIPHDLSPASDLKSSHNGSITPIFFACTLSDYWVLHPEELSTSRPAGRNRRGMSDEDDDHAPVPGVAIFRGRDREEDELVPREAPRGPMAAVEALKSDPDGILAGRRLRSGVEGIPDAVLPRRGSIPRDGPAAGDPDADPLSGHLRLPAVSRSTRTLPLSTQKSDLSVAGRPRHASAFPSPRPGMCP